MTFGGRGRAGIGAAGLALAVGLGVGAPATAIGAEDRGGASAGAARAAAAELSGGMGAAAAPADAVPTGEASANGAASAHGAREIDAGRQLVTLPTGDRLLITATEKGETIRPLGRVSGGGAQTMRLGGATYVVPFAVAGLAGRVLDTELFNLDAIADRGDGRTPVTITYRDATGPDTVPGVVITGRQGRSGTGYVDTESSAGWDGALEAGRADAAYAHVASVDVEPAEAKVPGRAPLHTLTVVGRTADGRPLDGAVGYISLTNPTEFGGFIEVVDGRGQVRVPAGTYQLVAGAYKTGDFSAYAFWSSRPLRIAGATSVTVDLAEATTPVRHRMFKPTNEGISVTELVRTVGSSEGSASLAVGVLGEGNPAIFASPTRGTLVGTQTLDEYRAATGGTGARPYLLTTFQRHEGRIPTTAITWRTDASNTMRYRTRISGAPDLDQALYMRSTQLPLGGWAFGGPVPGRTFDEYVTTGRAIVHGAELDQFVSLDEETFALKGVLYSVPRLAPGAGSVRDEEWNAAPVRQTFAVPRAGELSALCPACVSAAPGALTFVTLHPAPMSDPDHLGAPDFVNRFRNRLALRADGVTLFDIDVYPLVASDIPRGTRRLELRQTSVRSGAPYPVTTRLTTTVSTPLAAAIPAPPAWYCDGAGPCQALPMLGVAYDAPLTPAGTLAPGRRAVTLTVSQVGRTAAQGIRSVKAWASYDGRTWAAVPVTGSGAARVAHLTVPQATAGRTVVGLRVDVTDAAGSRLSERIEGAFRIAR